jgi:OOP family OmpA-OmpF porin
MNFETWTNTIGLLGHAGFGLGFRKTDGAYAKDRMGNFMAGVTIKLSDRVALTGFTTIPMQNKVLMLQVVSIREVLWNFF